MEGTENLSRGAEQLIKTWQPLKQGNLMVDGSMIFQVCNVFSIVSEDILGINETAAAANAIWETAKRLITALAAVGVVLTAGSQFASLGKINSIFFFLIAIAGVIGGFSGVEIVLWYIVRASTPEYLTLSKLIELDSIV